MLFYISSLPMRHNIKCNGNESNLSQCNIASGSCNRYYFAGVKCNSGKCIKLFVYIIHYYIRYYYI